MNGVAGDRIDGSSARQSTLRVTNLGLVLRLICSAEEPMSRAAVAAESGMTRSTVSRLVDELVAGQLVREEPAVHAGPGRPAIPLVPAQVTVGALGLQANAAHVAVRLIDLSGQIVAQSRTEPDLVNSDPDEALGLLAEHTRTVLAQRPASMSLVGAGLALPGLVDTQTGILLHAPNLAWREVDPKTRLEESLAGLPLSVGNEANRAAAAMAQPRPGRRGPAGDFIYISGEIGIGAAVVTNWRVQPGPRGWAGELGHMPFDPSGPACPCGSTGCLERYAGRRAIVDAAGLPAGSTLQDVATAASDGHRPSQEAVERAGTALGTVLAGAINLLDIPTVVLGGEIASLTELVRGPIERSLRDRVLAGPWSQHVVMRAPDDEAAAASGAAIDALQEVLLDPATWLTR